MVVALQAVILVQDESADGNLAAAAVAQRLDDSHVGSPGQIDIFPQKPVARSQRAAPILPRRHDPPNLWTVPATGG